MSSRAVKWLLLASVLLLAFPVVAGASTARVAGLGIQGDYIKDYTGVFTYLSNICCVGNVVYGELGNNVSDSNTDDRAVGAFLGNLWDGKYGAWGIHLREEIGQIGQADANTPVGAGFDAWDPNNNTSHSFDLMWGKKFGATSLGLQLSRAYARLEGDPVIFAGAGYAWNDIKGDWLQVGPGNVVDLNYNRNVLGFGAGLGHEFGPKFTGEVAVHYQSRTFEANDTLGNKYVNDGGGAYLVAARGMWQWQPDVLVVPVVKFYSFSAKAKAEPSGGTATTPIDDTRTGWQAGLAGNWTINQNDLFVLGATVGQNTEKYKNDSPESFKYTESIMPAVFAALETHVNPWLTLRFGAQQGAFYSFKIEDILAKNTTTEHYSPFDMMMGAGVKLGNLQLDGTLSQSFFHNGPYLVSGQSTTDLFPRVSAVYSF
jgi:hypothetical protein